MYQSHNKSCCSGSVVAGWISGVVLHSTLATRELSSSCSHPPSSANQRCSNAPAALRASLGRPSPFTLPPFTLHSATLHSHLSFRRTDNLPSSSSSSSNCARTATPYPPIVELQLPSVKLLILPQSVERQPTTMSSSNGTPTDLAPIPLRTFDTRQATTRPTTHVTVPPKHHLVQQRHPQVQQIVTDLLPIPERSIDTRQATAHPTAHRTAHGNVSSHNRRYNGIPKLLGDQ
jgi:hypothetical protein